MSEELDKIRRAEASFWDAKAEHRARNGIIPETADIRRATRITPRFSGEETVDREMTAILDGRLRSRFIDCAAQTPNGRVLDVCCGPGWLALELGRRGQRVDAWDISSEAITIGNRMLEENPYRNGFGQVTYHLGDVTKADLGFEIFDAVTGWSGFHHLPNLPAFMDRIFRALKPGGIVATLDDLPRTSVDRWLERFFRMLLPSYDRTYRQKVRDSFQRITGVTREPSESFSPMEVVAGKHTDAVRDMEIIWRERFELVWSFRFNSFATNPCMSLRGPDWFRYPIAGAIVGLDRAMCNARICHGRLRIMVSRKR